MTISKYGIILRRIKEEHIEMIRHWRNDPKIKKHMFYQGTITEDMQQDWFQSINNEQNYYFLIYADGTACGLISISSIDFDSRNAFAGLFIYDDRYIGTDIPVRASLSILDVFFDFTNIESVYAKVRDNNLVAHVYNTSLGFKRIKKIELGQGYEYCLKKESYLHDTSLLHKATAKLYGAKTKLEFDKGSAVEGILKGRFMGSLPDGHLSPDLEII